MALGITNPDSYRLDSADLGVAVINILEDEMTSRTMSSRSSDGWSRKLRWIVTCTAGAVAMGGVAISSFAGDSVVLRVGPVTVKPPATQVEPEVLASLRAAKSMAATEGRRSLSMDKRAVTLLNNLGNPDTDPYARVTGTVVNAKGWPMADAAVVLMDTNGDLMAETQTDFAGRYEVTSLQEGPYVVQVLPSAKDSAQWARTWYPEARSFLRADVLTVTNAGAMANVSVQPGARVDLTVVAQGKPVVGATVQVCGESYLDCQAATSDAKGTVSLVGLPVTPLRVAVTTTGGTRYEFVSAVKSVGANPIRLDTMNGTLVAKGQ